MFFLVQPIIWLALFSGGTAFAARSLDDILPASLRICGELAHDSGSVRGPILIRTEEQAEYHLDGPEIVTGVLRRLSRRFAAGVYVCVPAAPSTPPDALNPIWVPWFVYYGPTQSGFSVVNR